jgi:predicted phosphodiesterase
MHHPYFLTPDCDVVIYGHLHKFECEKRKALFLNPGEICAREKPLIESALLDTKTLEVEYVYKDSDWKIKRVCE